MRPAPAGRGSPTFPSPRRNLGPTKHRTPALLDHAPPTAPLALLERLIATPSYSREESATAGLVAAWLTERGCPPERRGNNVWARTGRPGPLVLLNSHHDTVRPNAGWADEPSGPHAPTWDGDRLVGLGSNDAGGPLVALLAAYVALKDEALPFELCVAATAEEEVSGAGGVASILGGLGEVACGIVGEPTSLAAAVSEKGLVVVDGLTRGRSGHAARREGANALYRALDDVAAVRAVRFGDSPTLGEVLATVTQIEAGTQHNVVPAECRWVVDVRTTDAHTNDETVALLRAAVSEHTVLTPRSTRLQPSGLSPNHPLYRAAVGGLGLRPYGSPTLSDQALLPFPTLKLGPGDSSRSHTAGEFIRRGEVEAGVATYVRLLRELATVLRET